MSIYCRSSVAIFDGVGASSQSSQALFDFFHTALADGIKVKKVNVDFIKNADWEKETGLLVMGGGKCSEWEEALGERGKEKIQNFVREYGGGYLGFCAGAYYTAENRIFFQSGSPPIKKTGLGFVQKVIGPLFPTSDPLSIHSAKALRIRMLNGENGRAYYQGGGYFVFEQHRDVRVIANYEDKAGSLPVVISIALGNRGGRAVVSALHPEFTWNQDVTGVDNERYRKLVKKLAPYEKFRYALWFKILNEFNLGLPKQIFKLETPLE